jgi:hypothetical protein
VREALGLLLLNAGYAATGAAVLAGVGLVRSGRSLVLHLGLALVVGWALVGSAAATLLALGLGATVLETAVVAAVIIAAGVALARRVTPRPASFVGAAPGWQTWLAVAGASVLLLVLAALLRRASYAQPVIWDSWAFWLPKAESIFYFDGIDTGPGGFLAMANPDYPVFAPATEALTYRIMGGVDNGVLAVQHWVLAAAFFAGVAVVLGRRVPAWVLWPGLAMAAVMPGFDRYIASSLGDEPLALQLALAGVCGAIWLTNRETAFGALAGVFLVAATLTKNEGFLDALLLALLLAAATRFRRWVAPVAIAAACVVAVLPWKLWLRSQDVPVNPAYDPGDLLRPGYLAGRLDRLSTALLDVPPYFFDWDAWLLTLPLAIALGLALLRRRPGLSLLVIGSVAVVIAGNLTVYWVSTLPVSWYIRTSADRTSFAPVLLCAVLIPLLAAEALATTRRVE